MVIKLLQEIGYESDIMYIQHIDTPADFIGMESMTNADMYKLGVGNRLYGVTILTNDVQIFISSENSDRVEYFMWVDKNFLFEETEPVRSMSDDNAGVTVRFMNEFGNVTLEYKDTSAACLGVIIPYEFWMEVEHLVEHGIQHLYSISSRLVYRHGSDTNVVCNKVGYKDTTTWIQVQDMDPENSFKVPNCCTTIVSDGHTYAIGYCGLSVYLFVGRAEEDRQWDMHIAARFDGNTIINNGDSLVKVRHTNSDYVEIFATDYTLKLPINVWDLMLLCVMEKTQVDERIMGLFYIRSEDSPHTEYKMTERAKQITGMNAGQMVMLSREYPQAYADLLAGLGVSQYADQFDDIKKRFAHLLH